MTYLITPRELEDLSETELRSKFSQTLGELSRKQMHAADCPLTLQTLLNILEALRRKRARQSRYIPMLTL